MAPRSLRALVLTCSAALLLAACGDDPELTVDEAPAGEEAGGDEDADGAAEDDGLDDAGGDEGSGEDGSGNDAEDAASPDAELVADPCAPHEDRIDESFIELASPVDGQAAGDSLDLVGCSNVFEANVQWELKADGELLDDGFTTAECGTGCVGAFEEELTLDAASGHDEVTLTVFAPDMSDGEAEAEQPSVTVTLQL